MKYSYVVMMNPVPKDRPRTTTKGSQTWTYTPQRTVLAERTIKDYASGKGAWFKEHQGIKLEATFYREEPDSPTCRRLRQLCTVYKVPVLPLIEPDVDNYFKTLADALSGIAYVDDCQITSAVIKKRYGRPARIVFTLEEDNGE